jgi:hypothetical protein
MGLPALFPARHPFHHRRMTDGAIPAGLSAWETDLFRHLSAHLQEEGALLGASKTLSEQADAEYVAYLIGIILEDEFRHHRLLTELVDTLRGRVEWTDRPSVPDVANAANPIKLLMTTETLLDREQSDARELQRLSRELRPVRGTSVWPVLIEIMERDTEKHQGILRFVQHQLDDQLKQARTSWL